MRNGLKNGHGTYWDKDGKLVYTGEHLDGVEHGKGKYTFLTGIEYEGEFFKGELHGHGVLKYLKEDCHDYQARYVGAFVDGLPSGKGTFWDVSGAKYYSDNWTHDPVFGVQFKNV